METLHSCFKMEEQYGWMIMHGSCSIFDHSASMPHIINGKIKVYPLPKLDTYSLKNAWQSLVTENNQVYTFTVALLLSYI